MKRDHLWRVLVNAGIFPTKDEAVRWILAGKVYVNDERMANSGTLIPIDSSVRVRDLHKKYVGKGGHKLEGALRDFSLDIFGLTALDAGASTGGFTDCMLQHGAKKVYSVDTGFGQLAGSLRVDKRVVNMEKTNIGEVAPDSLIPRPDFAAADLSYLSLRNAIPILSRLVRPGSTILCLVKPLFEIEDSEARRSGTISAPSEYIEVLKSLADWVFQQDLCLRGLTNSSVTGSSGTIEFFLRIENRPSVSAPLVPDYSGVVAKALSLK